MSHFYKTTRYALDGSTHESGFWWPSKDAGATDIPANPPEAKESTSRDLGAVFVKPQKTPPAPRPATTTGLITREDFFREAEKLGVLDSTMTTKIAKWFVRKDSGEVGEGMCRMQVNLLIRNAVKKKLK